MSRRRTTCSQCGQEGHNRRNLSCPINVRLREFAWEEERAVESERLRQAIVVRLAHVEAERLRHEEEDAVRLRAATAFEFLSSRHPAIEVQVFLQAIDGLVAQYDRRVIGRHTFIVQVLDIMKFVCCSIRYMVDNELERRDVIASFVLRIACINHALWCMNPHEYVEMVYEPTRSWVSFRIIPSIPDNRQPKLSSAYWKECSLVKDSSIGEEEIQCPLCFDQVSGPDVIRTNCKHSYCGCCIKQLASSSRNKTQKPTCPMCRTDITELTVGNDRAYTEISTHFTTL